MSDDLEAMQQFRDFLASTHAIAADSYTLDWSVKTITITAYAKPEESKLINRYIENSPLKFKQ